MLSKVETDSIVALLTPEELKDFPIFIGCVIYVLSASTYKRTMRRGSWHGMKGGANGFGADDRQKKQYVKDLGSRLSDIQKERRGSLGKIKTPHLIEPTFSSPPYRLRKGKKNLKLRPGSAHPLGRSVLLSKPSSYKKNKNKSRNKITLSSMRMKDRFNSRDTINVPDQDQDQEQQLQQQQLIRPVSGRRTRPATASKSRVSSAKRRGNKTNMPIEALGHSNSPNVSINAAYSDFVRMMALFYDKSDHAAIAEKACQDAVRLQEKMTLRDEYTM